MTSFAPSGTARIAYDVTGTGPPVLLVHAGVTDRRSWHHVVDDLSPDHSVVAFDQRGFGDTTYEAETYSAVDDAVAVLDHAGVDGPVAVVGCSMGGRLSLDLALAHPDRVDRLVLIGSACRGAPDPWPDDYPESYRAVGHAVDAAEEAGDHDEVNRLEAWLWLDGPTAAEGRVGGGARELFLEMNGQALRAEPTGDEHELPSAWDRLSDLRAPTMVLLGDLDLEDIAFVADGLTERIPGAGFERLESTAHVPQLEGHPRCLAAIREFLD